ncbi:MAG: hypothetical protein AAFP99_06715 [Pseudomonadota bacterium]
MGVRLFLLLCGFLLAIAQVQAVEITSTYSKLEVGEKCVQFEADEIGGSFACPGHGGYGVLFSEYDLRTSIFYGFVGDWYADGAWESFQTFNSVNDTIEWRLHDGVPRASILRWFIEFADPATGSPTPETRGEILVVSKVAQPGASDACVMAYVDARANADANMLARKAADDLVATFRCRIDEPKYVGEEGLKTGFPVRTFSP